MSVTALRPREPGRSPVRRRSVLAVVAGAATAVSYIRFLQPFRYLEVAGYDLQTLDDRLSLIPSARGYVPEESLLDGVSLLMFPQMVAAPPLPDGSRVHLVEPLCEMARRRGIKIVWSVDDYVHGIESHNPGYERIRGSIDNLRALLEHADAFLVTTPELERSLARHGKPIHVLYNAVDPAAWRERPRASGELRVGWTGSSSHLDDLLMVAPALRRLQSRCAFRFWLQGLIDMPFARQLRQIRRNRAGFSASQREIAERFEALHGALASLDYVHLPFEAVDRFFERLPGMDLDIGICPLVDSEFNRHKSANKFYEYAVTGSMTVASDVVPYRDEVSVTTTNDPAAWCDTLERYLRDDAARERELASQREFVLTHRNIECLRHGWAEALEEILQS